MPLASSMSPSSSLHQAAFALSPSTKVQLRIPGIPSTCKRCRQQQHQQDECHTSRAERRSMSSIRMWPASSTTPGQPARLTSCYARDLQQQQQQQLLLHLKQQRESRLLAFLAAQDEAALAQSSATAAAAAWKMTSLSGSSLITKRQGSTSTKTTRAFASTARDLYDERQQPSLQNVAVHEEQPEEQAGSAPRSPANSPPPRPRSENCELAGDDNRDGSTATNWEQMPRDMIPSSTSTSTPTGGAIHRRSSDPRRSTRNRSTEHPPRLRNMNGSGDEDERLQEAVPTPAAVADSETHGYPSNDGVRAPGAAAVDEDREEAERKAEVRAARARRQRNRRKRDRAFQAARKALVKKVTTLGKSGHWREAISEVESAVAQGLPPDVYVYGSCVGAAAENGRWRESLEVLQRMRQEGIAPTTTVYNAAIKACSRGGQLKLVLRLLDEMRHPCGSDIGAGGVVGRVSTSRGDGTVIAAVDVDDDAASRRGGDYNDGCDGAVGGDGNVSRLRDEGLGNKANAAFRRGTVENVNTDGDFVASDGSTRGGKAGVDVKHGNDGGASEDLSTSASSSAGCSPDIQTFNTVMAACVSAGKWELALEIMKLAARDGLHPNRVTYNTAISACARGGRKAADALELLGEMRSSGLVPDTITYNSVMAACAWEGHWKEALSLLAEMETSTGVAGSSDAYSYSSAITACGRGGQWERAAGLLDVMRRKRISPGQVAYNAAIAACGEAGQWERAVDILREMELEGEKEAAAAARTGSEANPQAGENGDVGGTVRLPAASIGPDTISYNSAINACSNAGEWQGAVSLLEEMRRNRDSDGTSSDVEHAALQGKRGVKKFGLRTGSASTSRSDLGGGPMNDGDAANVAAARGNVGSDGKSSRQRPREAHGCRLLPPPAPDVVSYSTAITACSRAGKWDRAFGLLDEMKKEGLAPNVTTFTAAIAAYRRGEEGGGQPDVLLALLDRMRSCGVSPDALFYSTALSACADASLCDRARSLLADMVAAGIQADDGARAAVAAACAATSSCSTTASKSSRLDLKADSEPDLRLKLKSRSRAKRK